MAALSAAWRLSEPGWHERFESITVYQRGWRLGGKGASSRGPHGRIQEHGLHIWLGSYENAFALLRECYEELDRPQTDPESPISHWWQALVPADNPGLADRIDDSWLTWLGTHPTDEQLPGEPTTTGRELTVIAFVDRALRLLLAFADSLAHQHRPDLVLAVSPIVPTADSARGIATTKRVIMAALAALAENSLDTAESASAALDSTLSAVRGALADENDPGSQRAWLLLSLITASVRGVIADNLVTHPAGFRAVNDEEFGGWLLRHGAHADVLDSPMIRGLYDLVFGYHDGDPQRPAVAAGLMLFLLGTVLFGYKGALFWKMTAGMGDTVIAPLYQALSRRGVRFEFFHRLESLHLSADRAAVESVTVIRQVRLANGGEYQPLVTVKGLAVFPDVPLSTQLICAPSNPEALESHFGEHSDAEARTLHRGRDFDRLVLAVSHGMLPVVATELIEDRSEWREMVSRVRTVATQAYQLWLWPTEAELGWPHSGSTISAYKRPFETWASMPQTLWAENWPPDRRPGTVAYFCSSLSAPWPTDEKYSEYVSRLRHQVYSDAASHTAHNLSLFFPNLTAADHRFRHELVADEYVSVNIDPSDRYVQSVPGSDKYRLRVDESGYDNLVLAGDWTDCGMNAGCIEAAVMSGLEAANVVLGRGRFHRIRGYWLP